MPATGARRGNLVYHWRHGWIPLDHFAALSKAHHSRGGAVKVMQKHGIDVPHGYMGTGHHGAPKVSKIEPPKVGAKVRDLPAGDTFKGVHSETHMGEKITVRKGKEWGTLQTEINGHHVGTPYGTRNNDAVKELNSLKATVEHAKANPGSYTNGAGEASYGMKLAPKAAERRYSDAEIKRGYDLYGKPISQTPAHVAASMSRAHVTHSGDGTLLSIDRNDIEARDAAKAAGFRWSSNIGSWYLPRNHSESTRRYKVSQLEAKLGKEHVHVEDAGHGKTTTAAEREAARKEASAARAERLDARTQKHLAERDARYNAAKDIMDRIPMGQPILVGHHSERGARADQKRIHSHSDKMVEAHHKAEYTQRAAEAARHNAESVDSPLKRQRRIDRNEAEIRSIDKKLQGHKLAVNSPNRIMDHYKLSEDYHAKLTAMRAELADQVAHDKAQIEASGKKIFSTGDVKAGDLIVHRGRTHIVSKVNKTTVSVPSGYSWDDKVPANQIQKHLPLAQLSDDNLRAVYSKAAGHKIQATYAAEMKRRGLAP